MMGAGADTGELECKHADSIFIWFLSIAVINLYTGKTGGAGQEFRAGERKGAAQSNESAGSGAAERYANTKVRGPISPFALALWGVSAEQVFWTGEIISRALACDNLAEIP